METGFWLNVAQKAHGPAYLHFCRVYCGDHHSASVNVARDVAARFPAPEFKCELTYWASAGHTVDLKEPA